MLVTNVGGLGEIVHHGKMGYAVAPDAGQIAECLRDYDRQRRQAEFTDYLLREKNKYAWDKMSNAYLQLYSSLR